MDSLRFFQDQASMFFLRHVKKIVRYPTHLWHLRHEYVNHLKRRWHSWNELYMCTQYLTTLWEWWNPFELPEYLHSHPSMILRYTKTANVEKCNAYTPISYICRYIRFYYRVLSVCVPPVYTQLASLPTQPVTGLPPNRPTSAVSSIHSFGGMVFTAELPSLTDRQTAHRASKQ